MTAGHESARGGDSAGQHAQRGHGEYDGTDALMAAITGDPLPEEARRDPAVRAAHRAAEADVAVLRDQLARLAEVLTGEPGAEGSGAGSTGAVGAPQDAGPAAAPARRPRGRTRPAAPERPSRPPRPGRPGRPRRALRIALGSLAGAAAFCLALGFGRLVAQGGAGADDRGGASSAKGADAGNLEAGAAAPPADPERALACSRLVVEGTVVKVELVEDSPGSRVTLRVTRSYEPAHGPAEVAFLLDADLRPAPRPGQHVLVRVGRGERYASRWAVGDARVAAERAWITDALPGSRALPCPSGDAP
ncbi:hypothetical protein ACIP3A_11225 [Streptomyces tricolor]|uniref:hypothetical protein n=1 Tax=Streptomyces tricolor TaxID=68277 RepID=UPI00381D0658